MISANISNARRKHIYQRDGYRCAICDSTKYIQIHHAVPRGQGGSDSIHNLITLCSNCHALVHGIATSDWGVALTRSETEAYQEAITQAIVEYLADFYAPDWNPWNKHPLDPP